VVVVVDGIVVVVTGELVEVAPEVVVVAPGTLVPVLVVAPAVVVVATGDPFVVGWGAIPPNTVGEEQQDHHSEKRLQRDDGEQRRSPVAIGRGRVGQFVGYSLGEIVFPRPAIRAPAQVSTVLTASRLTNYAVERGGNLDCRSNLPFSADFSRPDTNTRPKEVRWGLLFLFARVLFARVVVPDGATQRGQPRHFSLEVMITLNASLRS